jgi:hypothetical protein
MIFYFSINSQISYIFVYLLNLIYLNFIEPNDPIYASEMLFQCIKIKSKKNYHNLKIFASMINIIFKFEKQKLMFFVFN